MDETYFKTKGGRKYPYRAVDKKGKTAHLRLSAKRDRATAMRFFKIAMRNNDAPEKVSMDQGGANQAAIHQRHRRQGHCDPRSTDQVEILSTLNKP
jgi:transposase-like protein